MKLQLRQLFEGLDAEAYTLPSSLTDARRAADTLEATWPEQPQHPTDARFALAGAIVTAARNGDPLPPADTYLAAVQEHEHWTALTDALATAREQASLDLDGALATDADTVIAEHLAPAMVDLQDRLAEIAALLPEDVSDRQMASPVTTAKARAAWRELDGLAARYNAIRQAQAVCYRATGGDPQDDGQWAMVDDLLAVWPDWRSRHNNMGGPRPAPWPDDLRNVLLWMQHHGARLVVLTRAEREQRWQDMYGAEQEERKQTAERARHIGGLIA